MTDPHFSHIIRSVIHDYCKCNHINIEDFARIYSTVNRAGVSYRTVKRWMNDSFIHIQGEDGLQHNPDHIDFRVQDLQKLYKITGDRRLLEWFVELDGGIALWQVDRKPSANELQQAAKQLTHMAGVLQSLAKSEV